MAAPYRVLVSGASGMVGRALVGALALRATGGQPPGMPAGWLSVTDWWQGTGRTNDDWHCSAVVGVLVVHFERL